MGLSPGFLGCCLIWKMDFTVIKYSGQGSFKVKKGGGGGWGGGSGREVIF